MKDQKPSPPSPCVKSRRSLACIPSLQSTEFEHMTTDFNANVNQKKKSTTSQKYSKKLRSISIGPGGLDAFKETSAKSDKIPSVAKIYKVPPKPILKLTMPPTLEIPSHRSARRTSPIRASMSPEEPHKISADFSNHLSAEFKSNPRLESNLLSENRALMNETRVNLKTEEEQHAAIRRREEKERQELEKEKRSRQDARRKSLANRRVSFAPEATLHTWDIVVEYQDSTTSTSSTRRAPSLSNRSPSSSNFGSNITTSLDSPKPTISSTSTNFDTELKGPTHKHHSQETKRRRGSAIVPRNHDELDDDQFSSSPLSNDSINDGDGDGDMLDEVASVSNSDLDDDDDNEGTIMTYDDGETTNLSSSPMRSSYGSGSSKNLKEALTQADYHAEILNVFSNKNHNVSSDQQNASVYFKPWLKKEMNQNIEVENEMIRKRVQMQKKASETFCSTESNATIEVNTANNLSEVREPTLQKAVDRLQTGNSLEETTTGMEITTALGGILQSAQQDVDKISQPLHKSEQDSTMEMEMEMTNVFGGILHPTSKMTGTEVQQSNRLEDTTIGMEITTALGGIIQSAQQITNNRFHTAHSSPGQDITTGMEMTTALGNILHSSSKMTGTEVQQSNRLEDTTIGMEMTTALGGIIQSAQQITDDRFHTAHSSPGQDITTGMEMTTALGNILHSSSKMTGAEVQQSNRLEDTTIGMEMTTALGGIIQSAQQITDDRFHTAHSSPGQDITTGMEMTTVLGGILQPVQQVAENRSHMVHSLEQDLSLGMEIMGDLSSVLQPLLKSTGSRSEAKMLMEIETDSGSPTLLDYTPSESILNISRPIRSEITKSESPKVARPRRKLTRRSDQAEKLSSPGPQLRMINTSKASSNLPSTPNKFESDLVPRIRSSTHFFKNKLQITNTPQSAKGESLATPKNLYFKDENTGIRTPCFILNPQTRHTTGIGLDKIGLGSPRVAALLDRRGSISDEALSFSPCRLTEISPVIKFGDPKNPENESDREIEKDNRESNATLKLREKIQSLTPKKNSVRGRKSLHVGTAKGILGKRPIELDEEDDEDNEGIKRLNLQASPVKGIKLQAPPSKSETTSGRITRAARKSIEESDNIPSVILSPNKLKPTSPKISNQNDMNPEAYNTIKTKLVGQEPNNDLQIGEDIHRDQRIQLQEFLDITRIRFMELNTSKRRHTNLSKSIGKGTEEEKQATLEDCVAAGAATIPMLELFQHACHELKRYISEGRKTIREIETETWEENPPLFREYISATSDMKVLMDNQLKNVKTHARLLSKGLWYDWRITLLSTLKEGLIKSTEEMINDEKVINFQKSLLDPVLPDVIEMAERLGREEIELKTFAQEMENCDEEELSVARKGLIAINSDVEAKKLIISSLRQQLNENEENIKAGLNRKVLLQEEIHECEKIREKCRGWTSAEVNEIKNRVDALERQYGWTITAVSGTMISMTYRREIQLNFDIYSLLLPTSTSTDQSPETSRIQLEFIGLDSGLAHLPLTIEKEFYLQCMRDYLQKIENCQTNTKKLLDSVSTSWNRVCKVLNEIYFLTLSYQTEVNINSISSLMIISTLILVPLTTKVVISFILTSQLSEDGIHIEITPCARVIYGERFNEAKMEEFIRNRCGNMAEEDDRVTVSSLWRDTVNELGKKLLARGRK